PAFNISEISCGRRCGVPCPPWCPRWCPPPPLPPLRSNRARPRSPPPLRSNRPRPPRSLPRSRPPPRCGRWNRERGSLPIRAESRRTNSSRGALLSRALRVSPGRRTTSSSMIISLVPPAAETAAAASDSTCSSASSCAMSARSPRSSPPAIPFPRVLLHLLRIPRLGGSPLREPPRGVRRGDRPILPRGVLREALLLLPLPLRRTPLHPPACPHPPAPASLRAWLPPAARKALPALLHSSPPRHFAAVRCELVPDVLPRA